jgi:hypothetical protein
MKGEIMTTKPQLQTEADHQTAKEVKPNREWKLNLVGAYFKTFETSNTISKEPPTKLLRGEVKYVLINSGLVLDERNVERGVATYAEDVGEWPKLYKEALQ